MSERYLVRCTAAAGRAMAGIYAARRLAGKFTGTSWEVCHD